VTRREKLLAALAEAEGEMAFNANEDHSADSKPTKQFKCKHIDEQRGDGETHVAWITRYSFEGESDRITLDFSCADCAKALDAEFAKPEAAYIKKEWRVAKLLLAERDVAMWLQIMRDRNNVIVPVTEKAEQQMVEALAPKEEN